MMRWDGMAQEAVQTATATSAQQDLVPTMILRNISAPDNLQPHP